MLYVIAEKEADGTLSPYVKVGYVGGETKAEMMARLKKRVNQQQVGNPRQLLVIGLCKGDREDEKDVHRRHRDARVRRPIMCEWLDIREERFGAWVATVALDEPLTFGWTQVIKGRTSARVARASAPREPKRPRAMRCWKCRATTHPTGDCYAVPTRLASNGFSPSSKKEWVWRGRIRT